MCRVCFQSGIVSITALHVVAFSQNLTVDILPDSVNFYDALSDRDVSRLMPSLTVRLCFIPSLAAISTLASLSVPTSLQANMA